MQPGVNVAQVLAVLLGFVASASAGTFSFVPGHYYATTGLYGSGAIVKQYDDAGQYVAARAIAGRTDLSDLTFGPDGNLYVKAYLLETNTLTVDILAVNERMEVQQRYVLPPGLIGSDIVFDDSGHFYWGNAQFDIGDSSSGRRFLPDGFSLKAILPNGHFLALKDNFAVQELDSSGTVLREIFRPQHPLNDWVSRIAYDPRSGALFASGGSGGYKIWSLDFATGDVLTSINFQTSHLLITHEGFLLASSKSSPARLSGSDLEAFLRFSSYPIDSVTQFVPEPAGWVLAIVGLVGWSVLIRRRRL